MCDHHTFAFDEDKAYEDQVVSALEASPKHPLAQPEAPRQPGVYVLFRSSVPVYVGKGKDLRSRLKSYLRRASNRKRIDEQEMTCRFLTIERGWEVLRAEAALIRRYNPEWNGTPGFSMHVAGRGRPGMPGYANEWDRRFPPRAQQ